METRRGCVIRFRLILAAVILFASVAPLAPVGTAAAAASTLTVTANTARSEFPKQLVFDLKAQSGSPITSVKIAYRVGDDPVTSLANVPVTAADHISTSYHIDLNQEYYPPGVTIHYQWRLTDQSSALLKTTWSNLLVVDPRFQWHEQTLGVVTVHWYEGNTQYATTMLGAAARALALASADINTPTVRPVQLFLYANTNDFRGAMGAGVDSWVGGQTYPVYRVVVLLAPTNDVANDVRSVAHEMTHVALDSTSDNPFGPLPSWLDEGMAQVAEGAPDPAFSRILTDAAHSNKLMSLQSLSGNFPESTNEAILAYAESDSIVRYFLQTYGRTKLDELIAQFRDGHSANAAFEQVVGISELQFQRAWEGSLGAQPAAAPQTSGGSSILRTFLAPVNVVAKALNDVVNLLRSTKGG